MSKFQMFVLIQKYSIYSFYHLLIYSFCSHCYVRAIIIILCLNKLKFKNKFKFKPNSQLA